MDCLPVDAECMIDLQFQQVIAAEGETFKINAESFDLGVFNGRQYTYTWIAGYPAIIIEDINEVKQPGDFPEDVLISTD